MPASNFTATRDVLLRLPTLDRAVAFYEDVLGFARSHDSDTLVGFETGAFTLYLDKGPVEGPVFEYQVADVPAARAGLLAAGCTLVREEGVHVWLRDPFGLVFNLIQS
jgi:catechol 2,3-dioxygenase-like lactoylglutathione lyase family enzyme